MSEIAGGRKITALTEKTTPSDTDLIIAGDSGTAALRKITLANLANWIKSKVTAFTWNFNVGENRTLQQAINALCQGAGTVEYTYSGGGYITTGRTVVAFTVPTNRVINGVSIQSVTLSAVQIRQNGDTIVNGTTDIEITPTMSLSGISISLSKMQGGSAVPLSDTNNDSVGVYIRFSVTWG